MPERYSRPVGSTVLTAEERQAAQDAHEEAVALQRGLTDHRPQVRVEMPNVVYKRFSYRAIEHMPVGHEMVGRTATL